MCVCVCALSHVQFFATPWTAAHQAPLSMEFSRQDYWSGLPLPTPGALPDPGIEPDSPASLVMAGRFFTPEPPGKPIHVTLKKQDHHPGSQLRSSSWSPPAIRYEYKSKV